MKMDLKKSKRDVIVLILLVALVMSSVVSIAEYNSINRAISSCVRSIILCVDNSSIEMEECATIEEKEQNIYFFSVTIRSLNTQIEELTKGSFFHRGYSLNELWRYISMVRSDSKNVDEAVKKYKKLNEIIKETDILEIVNNDQGVSMPALREKIKIINDFCSSELHQY